MFKVNAKTNYKQLEDYVGTRTAFFTVDVGTFEGKKNERKVFNNSKNKVHKRFGTFKCKTNEVSKVTNAEVALDNIKGTDDIPERNYFAYAFSKEFIKQEKLHFIKKLWSKTPDFDTAYKELGNLGVEMVQRAIYQLQFPANSEETIEYKGSQNPLIHSGQLLESIEYRRNKRRIKYLELQRFEENNC